MTFATLQVKDQENIIKSNKPKKNCKNVWFKPLLSAFHNPDYMTANMELCLK